MTLGLLAFPHSASAVTVWQGEAVVITATGTCTFPGDERRNIAKGTVLKSVFRPRAVDDNGGNTRISFTHDSGATFIMVLQDTGPNGDYARVGISHSATLFDGNGPLRSFASFQQVPPNVATNTQFVRLSGQVEDFMFLSGCTATFRASYGKAL
jgi:hypothetical protein